jgi:TonB family protein
MNWRLVFDNLVAYSLQIGMLVGLAAVIPTVLRLRQPGAKLVYWQILLAACLLLPLQPWKQAISAGTVEVTTTITAVQPAHRSPSPLAIPRGEMALLVVLAGAAIRLGWLAVGFWKLRRYRRLSRPLEPAPAWSVEASLLLSDEIASPVTFGWRKPVVLLPANFPALDTQVQDAILCHEVMHVRRGDWLFTVAEEIVRAIFWFHPAIWWLLGEIGLAREQEVDRLAIEITHEREQYMDALLAIAGARAQLDLAPAPLFLRKRHLRNRVISILQEAHMSKTRLISTLTTGLAVLVAACWLVTGAFPLTAEPQVVSDAAGVTVNLNGSTVLHRTTVHYPAAALQRGEQGSVTVEVKLDASGNVSDARVLSGPDDLRPAVLESVLEWHFTRDAAGGTRVVEVGFELPPKGVVEGVPGGVQGGIVGGVPGGVTGGVIVAYRNGAPVYGEKSSQSFLLTGITVLGLSEPSRDELLAALPVHEGEALIAQDMEKAAEAVKAFDEHLVVRWTAGFNGTRTLQIIAPGVAPPPPPPPPPSAQAALENPPSKIKVGGNVQSMMIVTKVPPLYPALAKVAGVQGVVRLAVIIAKDGTVQAIHVLDGPPLLVQAAMDAVKQWVYKPTFLNGDPVAVETTIDVNFTLSQ